MTNYKLSRGMQVIRKVGDNFQLATVWNVYGDLPHSAVNVHDVLDLATNEIFTHPMTWMRDEIETVYDVTEIVNPLPFEDSLNES